MAEAVADAVLLCGERQVPPPRWVCEALRVVVECDLLAAATRKWDMIHFVRWDAVQVFRERKGEPGIPKTWAGYFDAASEYLEGTAPKAVPRQFVRATSSSLSGYGRSRATADRYYLGRNPDRYYRKPG